MTACLFIGPSLPAAAAFDGIRLPPVRQGDVYRAVMRHRPDAIGIVDGFFHQVPAVCHKEILWALAQGIPVLGAASMGALRAAELAAFGMIGIGRVFEAYRDGALPPYEGAFEDDDEVAVIHGPPDLGYVAVSEAMVNIRMTLAAATAAGLIDAATRDRLAAIGKALFYPERSYARIFGIAAEQGMPAPMLSALDRWIARARIDQKREDALALLAALREPPRPTSPNFSLAHTTMWQGVMTRALPDGDGSATIE